jgi:EAL domain-containing protein (putative c-di-GMP-specific phosphodiesterase class I)
MIRQDLPGPDCPDCEVLPERLAGPGRLHLWLPSRHSAKKLRAYLGRARRLAYEGTEDGRVIIDVDQGKWGKLLAELSDLFSPSELDDARALCKPGSDEPTLADFPRMRTLEQLVAFAGSDWLVRVLLERRLNCVFQPIVWADDSTCIYAQECLLRAEAPDGSIVSAGAILDAARRAGLLAQTDLAARHGSIREAARHGVEGDLFISLSPTRICDPASCLRSTLGALGKAGIPHTRVVFELTETDEPDVYALRALPDYCRNEGFRVALDDVGSGYSSLNLIHRLRPDFIKLDAELIRGVERDPHKAVIARRVIELAHDLGMGTIAEGVETPGELEWVRAHGATFAQGWLIAKPTNPPVGDGRALTGLNQEARATPH